MSGEWFLFQHMMDVHRWVAMPTIPSSATPRSMGANAAEDVSPPYSLMEHHPLAAFVNGRDPASCQPYSNGEVRWRRSLNLMCYLLAGLWLVGAGVLSALNQLRHFAPTSIKPRLAAQLQQALQAVGGIMVRYHDPRGARETETTLFLAMCKAFIEVRPRASSSSQIYLCGCVHGLAEIEIYTIVIERRCIQYATLSRDPHVTQRCSL